MTPDHYQALALMMRTHLTELFPDLPPAAAMAEWVAMYDRRGLSERRALFDLLYAIPYSARSEWFELGIYDYLNDDHIFTALKMLSRYYATS